MTDTQRQDKFLAALERKEGSIAHAMRASRTSKYYIEKWGADRDFQARKDEIIERWRKDPHFGRKGNHLEMHVNGESLKNKTQNRSGKAVRASKNGKLFKTFITLKECAKFFNTTGPTIANRIKHKTELHGYKFKYAATNKSNRPEPKSSMVISSKRRQGFQKP